MTIAVISRQRVNEFDGCIVMCVRLGDYQYLLLAITSLEQGVKKSPSNFHMKLLLIKIYNTIGECNCTILCYQPMFGAVL